MQTSISPTLRAGFLRAEAAAFLGVSTRTLTNWARKGFGPQPIRDGGRLIYDPVAVVAFKAGVR